MGRRSSEDVDDLLKDLEDRMLEFIRHPDWCTDSFDIFDPDGNVVEVGTKISIAEIIKDSLRTPKRGERHGDYSRKLWKRVKHRMDDDVYLNKEYFWAKSFIAYHFNDGWRFDND